MRTLRRSERPGFVGGAGGGWLVGCFFENSVFLKMLFNLTQSRKITHST